QHDVVVEQRVVHGQDRGQRADAHRDTPKSCPGEQSEALVSGEVAERFGEHWSLRSSRNDHRHRAEGPHRTGRMSSANAYPQPPQCALEHRGATTVADEIHGRMLAQGERVRDSLRPLSDPSLSDEAVWAIVDAAPDGFVVVDAANQILMVNR